MAIILPDEELPAINNITAGNLLIYGDYGVGKSGLLASTKYLIANPEAENKIRQYPCLSVQLNSWQDHLDFTKALAIADDGKYPGIGLDSLNISYDYCLAYVMAKVKFNGIFLSHPSENPTMCYPRITMEFITWLRELTVLGYHVIATSHANISEVKVGGYSYNSFVPAFTGASPTSTYAGVLKVFSTVGYMCMEEAEKPPTAKKLGKEAVDVRSDASRIGSENRVIHFKASKYWLANNKRGGFPDTIKLSDDWSQDWNILKDAWGKENRQIAKEGVESGGLEVEE